MVLMIVIIYILNGGNKKQNTFTTYGIKFLSGYGLLLNTITIIPFFNIYFAALYCKEES